MFRGYFEANGRFQLSDAWSLTGFGRYASDRTFLRRYDISRDDRLRSSLNLERIDDSSYFSLAGWAVQTMRRGDRQGLIPIALPAIEYRRRIVPPKIAWHAGTGGQFARAFACRRAEHPARLCQGAVGFAHDHRARPGSDSFTALVRGDVYHSNGTMR